MINRGNTRDLTLLNSDAYNVTIVYPYALRVLGDAFRGIMT